MRLHFVWHHSKIDMAERWERTFEWIYINCFLVAGLNVLWKIEQFNNLPSVRKPSSWASEDLHRYLTTPQHLNFFVQICRSHRKQHGKLLVSDDTSFVIEKLWFCVLMRRKTLRYLRNLIFTVFQKTSCLQLIWRSTDCFMKYDASLFLYKFLCRKEARSICISSIIKKKSKYISK